MAATPPIHTSNVPPGLVDHLIGLQNLTEQADGPKKTVITTVDELALRLLADSQLKEKLDLIAASAARPNWKDPVLVASTVNVDLAAMQAGVTLDGVVLAADDRVFLGGQSAPAENGIYRVRTGLAPVRSTDADTGAELTALAVFVRGGTANGGKQFGIIAATNIIPGTTPLPVVLIADQTALNANLAGKAAQAEVTALSGNVNTVVRTGTPGTHDDGALPGATGLRWGFTDPAGNPIAGVNVEGELIGRNPLLAGTDLLSPYMWAAVTEDGYVMLAVDHTGALVSGAGAVAAGMTPATLLVGGVQTPYIVKNSLPRRVLYSTVGTAALLIAGDMVQVATPTGTYDIEVAARHGFNASVTAIRVIAGYGQSLSVGSSSTPPTTTVALDPGRAQMFNVGPRTGVTDATTADASLYSLQDLRESSVETPTSHMAHQHALALPASTGLVGFTAGIGGRSYAQLKKGTAIYAGLLKALHRAKIMANLNGLDFLPALLTFTQGEADRAQTEAYYKAGLVELQADITADCAPLYDVATQVRLFVDQISNFTAYSRTDSEVPFAQLNAALENPTKITCIGPKYMLPTVSDGIHLTNTSSALLGDYHGAIQAIVMAGSEFKPTHVMSSSISGSVVALNFHVPEGEITIDTASVSNPGNYGVDVLSGGNTIVSVVKSGPAQVQVTLNAAPAAGTVLGIAARGISGAAGGPTTGARSCFRDQSTKLATDGVTRLFNWACHQKISIN